MAEGGSLNNSNRMIQSYLQTGQETLAELHSQRDRMKGIQKKVFDMFNYLGLSNSIMKSVSDRDKVDTLIVYGGMVVVSLLVIHVRRLKEYRVVLLGLFDNFDKRAM